MNLRREAITSETYWDFQPGERVMTVDGYPGVVDEVQDGPIANAENYVVTLDRGMGGGNYSASMLTKMPTSRSAAGVHLATDDYPELGTVIDDRPDPGKMSFTAALSQEREEADSEDHDEPGGDDQPSSCSYCGGTEFTDKTDNGRVRQATCAVCNGTMSAHPGMQWTPELIGDPSNHPKTIVDPRSGASPGAGAPGQAGINDFVDFDSRVSTTAAYTAGPCPTCKGKGTTSWTDQDPDWDGDPDENPGKVHTAPCDDCDGKGHMPAVSDDEIAHLKQQADESRARSTAQHVQEKHPVGEVVTYDDVKGCGPRCPVATEWDRRGKRPFYHQGGLVNLTLLNSGVSEAARLLRMATRDRDLGFHITASWADVQRKAKRIRSEGGVTIVVASNDGVGGHVTGDHGTYEALLVYRPGTKKVGDWTCGCKWAAYAFERSPGFQRFEGRKCSHALALQFEAQSQGMFGKEVHPSEPTSRERTVVRYDPDAGEHVFARPYEGSLVGSMVARLREEDADPAEVIGNLVRAGVRHRTAVLLWKSAEHHEDGERRCPHCGGFIGVEAVEHHHCPHCGAPLGGEGHEHHHEGSLDVSPVDAVDDATHGGGSQTEFSRQSSLGLASAAPNSDVAHLFGRDLREGATTSLPVSDVVELGASAQVPQVLARWVVAGVPSGFAGVADVSSEGPAVGARHPGRSTGGVSAIPEQPGTARSRQAAHPGVTGIGTARTIDQRFVTGVDADGLAPTSHAGALRHDAQTSKKKSDGPSVSGIALKAHDTGRVLMLQRGLDDPNDPAAGTWEFPGGHHEEGDQTSLHAGIREFEEEVGQEFPTNGAVKHVWTSPNGVYQGHVVVIPSEKDLSMKDGRVVPNPDDPKGDCHEQAAWWDPEHARKIPNLRAEVKENTPWKEIGKASLDAAKAASAWDPISNTNPQPGRGTSEPAHSNTTNPASTGWAAGEDPDNWGNLDANPQPLTPSLGFDAALHDEPEPALPVAYGDENATMRPAEMTHDDLDPIPDNPPAAAELVPDSDANIHLLDGGSSLPNSYHAAAESDLLADIVASFQKSAAGQSLMTESEGDGNEDIAAAARAHLEKTAAKQFDFAEQQELITEGQTDGRRARNLAALRIKGTHYELLDAALAGEATDSTDLFI